MDIVLTGYIAAEGTRLIAHDYEEKLCMRLPRSIIDRAKEMNLQNEAVRIKEFLCGKEKTHEVLTSEMIIYEVGEGGIFAALWNVGYENDLGITVFLEDIYIKQETIEVCEVFDINPYMLNGLGSLIIITDRGNELVRIIRNMGCYASVIGYTTRSKDRVVINNGERRFIESRIRDDYERL